jgi:hypothetical protein
LSTKPRIALRARGKLTFDPALPGRTFGTYVFQKTIPGLGNIPNDPTQTLQLRRWVIGTNPRTPAQQAFRLAFAAAMAAWRLLTPIQRADYNDLARPMYISGVNLFVRLYLQGHRPPSTSNQLGDARLARPGARLALMRLGQTGPHGFLLPAIPDIGDARLSRVGSRLARLRLAETQPGGITIPVTTDLADARLSSIGSRLARVRLASTGPTDNLPSPVIATPSAILARHFARPSVISLSR